MDLALGQLKHPLHHLYNFSCHLVSGFCHFDCDLCYFDCAMGHLDCVMGYLDVWPIRTVLSAIWTVISAIWTVPFAIWTVIWPFSAIWAILTVFCGIHIYSVWSRQFGLCFMPFAYSLDLCKFIKKRLIRFNRLQWVSLYVHFLFTWKQDLHIRQYIIWLFSSILRHFHLWYRI